MNPLNNNRLVQVFEQLREADEKTVLPFVTGGYPSCEATTAMLHEFERRGARVCEIGIPYSDPVADGPVIQASFTSALNAGVTWSGVCDAVRAYRDAGGTMAVLAMLSYSIVYRRGQETFCAEAATAGFDGLIVPDLPVEEYDQFVPLTMAAGLCNTALISPTTPEARKIELAQHSSGFVYYMSVAGITGERAALPSETIESVAKLRTHVDTPICIGFGVSTPEMVSTVCSVADGAIVGSAIIHQINDALKDGTDPVERTGEFVESLLRGAASS